MTVVQFKVPGQPVAKGRPRISTRGGFARAYTPQKTVAYEGLIAMAGQDAFEGSALIEGPIYLVVTATFQIPASWSKKRKAQLATGPAWHTSKPDGDNILKAVGDGLNGVIWKDDSQIVQSKMIKIYGETPGLHIIVEAL
jgi:Holliday junction resolvase RusA-like endonuclease